MFLPIWPRPIWQRKKHDLDESIWQSVSPKTNLGKRSTHKTKARLASTTIKPDWLAILPNLANTKLPDCYFQSGSIWQSGPRLARLLSLGQLYPFKTPHTSPKLSQLPRPLLTSCSPCTAHHVQEAETRSIYTRCLTERAISDALV